METTTINSRITGQDKVFVGMVDAEVQMEDDTTASFIAYKARKIMERHYGKGNVQRIDIVEDYQDLFHYDSEDPLKPKKSTWLVVRFLNPRTHRFYFEQITIMRLNDEDYESLNIEKVAI